MSTAPLNWIKAIHQTLIDSKEIPLHGPSPAFPWEEFSQRLSSSFESQLKITPRKTHVLSSEKAVAGFGAGFISIPLEMTPLGSSAFWLMGREEVAKFTALALKPSNGSKGFSSSKFQEGFYYFLATKILRIIDEMKTFGDLSLKLGNPVSLPEEEALCVDIEIKHPKMTLWGRLVCPHPFHEEFKNHFSAREPEPLTSELAKQIDVVVKAEIGQTLISLPEWKAISVGDFILLDRCTYDPETHKGTAQLTLHESPLLRVKIKENHLKIVDYALYREEQNPMTQNQEEENSEEPLEEEEHLWAAGAEEKMIDTNEIPMTLTVEVAHLQINLDKLLQLSPGNVLELPIKPEQGVNLTVGGKKVAHGELIKLGEMLGVKILQIGK